MRPTLVIFAFLLWPALTPATAGPLEDCVITGLRGVSSDAAAHMLRRACEIKVKEEMERQQDEKHGTSVDAQLTTTSFTSAGSALKIEIRNPSSVTATYVEVAVAAPDGKGICPVFYLTKYLYRAKLKPGSTAHFLAPTSSRFDRVCISAYAVRGRAPRWSDVSVLTYEPLPPAVIDQLNRDLGTSYATPDPEPRLEVPPGRSQRSSKGSVDAVADYVRDQIKNGNR